MKYKYILLSMIQAALFFSCYDLDRKPADALDENSFWKTQTHADQAMMGVYAQMQNDHVFGIQYGFDCLSDIGTGYDDPAYFRISRGTYNSSEDYCARKFANLYEGVARANAVLQNVDKITMSDELKARYKGEARFMRALYYFTLCDFYGGVPLYDETTVVAKDFANMLKPRDTQEAVHEFILKDLDEAARTLPSEWDIPNRGRATRWAALSLKGKTLLYGKKYKEAADVFEEVIKTSGITLYPDYAALFKPGGDESSEMIFAVQNMSGVGTEFGMPMAKYMGARAAYGSCWNNVMAATTFVDSYEWKDGRPFDWDEFVPGFKNDNKVKDKTFRASLTPDKTKVKAYPSAKEKLLEMYAKRDPRMAASIILPYSRYNGWVSNARKDCEYVVARGVNEKNGFIRINGSMSDSYPWRKFVPEYDMGGSLTNREHTPINFPIIRYADVLLMCAECHNETGNQARAVELINQVRARVEMPGLNSGPEWLKASTKEEVFKRIMHERAVEMAGEGLRFSDLRRWDLLKKLLDGKWEKGFTGAKYYQRVVRDRDYLWPIPIEEIDKNDKLVQNPGW